MSLSSIIDEIEAVAARAAERVSDFPGPTCPDIDAALRDIAPVEREATRLYRLNADNLKEDEGVENFVSDVLALTADELPTRLEALRSDNDSLRTSLTEALDRLQEVSETLKAIAGKMPMDEPAEEDQPTVCIQCSAGPRDGCRRDHREQRCWMEEQR